MEGEDKNLLANREKTGLISYVVINTPGLCSKECKMNKECLQWEWRQQLENEEIHKWVGMAYNNVDMIRALGIVLIVTGKKQSQIPA